MIKANYLLKQFIKISLIFIVSLLASVSAIYAQTDINKLSVFLYAENAKKMTPFKSTNNKLNKPQSSMINPVVRLLNREYEFIFFYESDCPYCIEFAPILKEYSKDTGIKIISFAFGDSAKALPLFVNSTPVDQGALDQFFGQGTKISTPALFIWNKTTAHVYPVASGMHSYAELAERMNQLTPKMVKNERELQNRN